MKEEIETAIKALTKKSTEANAATAPEAAMKYTQAALNLAHTLQVLAAIPQSIGQGE